MVTVRMRVALCLVLLGAGCAGSPSNPPAPFVSAAPFVMVLGTAQDAGFPQAGCRRDCCRAAWDETARRRHVVSLAIVNPATSQRWLVDASPDLPEQLHELDSAAPAMEGPGIDGIFLTHGHVGHYAGLMHLGREVMGTHGVPVHVMPRMRTFLAGSGPWSQLVTLGNIELSSLNDGEAVELGSGLRITPFQVPHRDEYTETVGFRIDGPARSVLYLPDIDKWERWGVSIEDLLADVDVAYLDGSFFDGEELPGRDMSEIPHPFVIDSMKRWAELPAAIRARVRFLHMNHTNPLLDPESDAWRAVHEAGFRVAQQGERVDL